MREIAIFKPQFDLQERRKVKQLQETLWDVLDGNTEPTYSSRPAEKEEGGYIPTKSFILHSIKVERTPDGSITAYDTSTEPYAPIYNRYILQLLIDNLLEE